jgi:hypothetical protein
MTLLASDKETGSQFVSIPKLHILLFNGPDATPRSDHLLAGNDTGVEQLSDARAHVSIEHAKHAARVYHCRPTSGYQSNAAT